MSGSPPDTPGAAGEILSPSAPLPARSPPPSPAAGSAITPGGPGDGKRVLKPDSPCGRAHSSSSSSSELFRTPAWAGGSGGGTGRFAERSPAAPVAFPRHPGGTQDVLPTPSLLELEALGSRAQPQPAGCPKCPQPPTPELLADVQAGAPGEALRCPALQPRQAGRQSLQLVGTPFLPVQKHPGAAAGGPPVSRARPDGATGGTNRGRPAPALRVGPGVWTSGALTPPAGAAGRPRVLLEAAQRPRGGRTKGLSSASYRHCTNFTFHRLWKTFGHGDKTCL